MSDKILEAEDILTAARDYIECVCLAAEALGAQQRGPIMRVADIAGEKIDEAIALLQGYRDAGGPLLGGNGRPSGTL